MLTWKAGLSLSHTLRKLHFWFEQTFALNSTCRSWEKAQATGDEITATENLRRFFEQHFHESNDSYVIPPHYHPFVYCDLRGNYSGVRQHALLNLVRMHYLRNEFPAARRVSLPYFLWWTLYQSTLCVLSFSLKQLPLREQVEIG